MYIKWEITKIRDSTTRIKITAFHAWDKQGNAINLLNVTCTINGNEPHYFSDDEHCENLIIDDNNKEFCCEFDTDCVLIFETPVFENLGEYSYTTGSNLPEWDPVSWKVYTSTDGGTWEEVDSVEDAEITQSRKAETSHFGDTGWYVDEDGHLTNERFEPSPDVMKRIYPLQYWRIEPTAHNGLPFHELLPGVERINPTPVEDRSPEDYICIFDMQTKQDEFVGHGLAVLCPTVCEITEELNGQYSLVMEHPKDSDGKWEYILEYNIIKARGQLFIITKKADNSQNGKGSITAWAEHISYSLSDDWIWPGTPVGSGISTGTDLIYAIMYLADAGIDKSALTYYSFTASSDVEIPAEFHDWDVMSEGATPYAMLLGNDGFIAKFGGELYRDNFYFSINQRMEGANDLAFELRVGKNMKSIRKTVDVSSCAFYFRVYDQYGSWYAISWAEAGMLRVYPRQIVRSTTIHMEDAEPSYYWDIFIRKCQAFFGQYCRPMISYEISVKDLKRNPDYREFLNVDRFKVGDKGRVWDSDFKGYMTLEVSKTVTDAITGEITEVCFGTARSFTRPPQYNPITDDMFTPIPVEAEINLQDADGNFLEDAEGYTLYEEVKFNG